MGALGAHAWHHPNRCIHDGHRQSIWLERSRCGAARYRNASRDRGHHNSRKRLAPLWVGAAILILTRRDGALWAALIAAVAFLPHGSPRQLVQRLVSSSKTRRAGVIAIPVVIASSFWVVPWVARFVDRRATAERSTWQAIRALRIYLDHLMGTFRWLDSTMGIEAFLISMATAGFFVILAISPHSVRPWSIVMSLMLLVIVPVAFGTIRYPYFQGRYLIPMWIAAMLLQAIHWSHLVKALRS